MRMRDSIQNTKLKQDQDICQNGLSFIGLTLMGRFLLEPNKYINLLIILIF